MKELQSFVIEKWSEFSEKILNVKGDEGHLSGWFINEITFIILIITSLYGVYKLIKILYIKINSNRVNKKLYKDLAYSSFSRSDVDKATKYYIPTKYQNVSPSDDEEPGSKYIASAKNELIPLFLKEVFLNNQNDNKYYLILADSGMGKTTFMINLYLSYKRKKRKTWQLPKLNMLLYSLGDPRTIGRIKMIENKHETILLLDAFDEDSEAIVNYKERMSKILEVVDDFHDIVITSRTQFFPSEIEEPYNTGYMSFGDSSTKRNFQKLYLSVFSNSDIKKYLRKRIPFFKIKKYRRALDITRKSPSLVVRPMLLSHIEDLASSKDHYHFTYEIYQVLIEKWVKREASKPGLEIKYGKGRYEEILKAFSKDLAIDMYLNRKSRGGYYAIIDESFLLNSKISFEDIENKNISDIEQRSRSLLNRDAEGKYKFSHKSIMEYFLALEIVANKSFLNDFDFKGLDASLLFYKEMHLNVVLSPVYEFYIRNINNKNLTISNQSKIGFWQKYMCIQKSQLLHERYKSVSNKIYLQDMKIRSGLVQFDFIYKIFIYNKLIIKLEPIFIQNKFDTNNLLYFIGIDQFSKLNKSIMSLEIFYFKSNKLCDDSYLIDYSKLLSISDDRQTFKIDTLEKHVYIGFVKILSFLENAIYITNSDNKSQLFIDNLRKLLILLEGTDDKQIRMDLEYLIGISFDLFTRRFYGDIFPFSSKNPIFRMFNISMFFLPSIVLLRVLRNINERR